MCPVFPARTHRDPLCSCLIPTHLQYPFRNDSLTSSNSQTRVTLPIYTLLALFMHLSYIFIIYVNLFSLQEFKLPGVQNFIYLFLASLDSSTIVSEYSERSFRKWLA
jgi:hypothetical protein